jgi:hypothetical protein
MVGLQQCSMMPILPELGEFDQRPQFFHHRMDALEQRAFDAHRVIEPRRRVARGMHFIDDVDAADERDARVDHRELAVHAAQPLPLERPRRDVRPVDQKPDAGALHPGGKSRAELSRSVPVNQQMRRHAALRRAF